LRHTSVHNGGVFDERDLYVMSDYLHCLQHSASKSRRLGLPPRWCL